MRWNHPDRGLVPPDAFIPVAEETGLIVPLGDWVLEQACRDAARWPEQFTVAVNLSAVQFRITTLALRSCRRSANPVLAASRLELEITESVLLQENSAVLDALHQFRKLGVRICMDDFGTGYSSLSYLRASRSTRSRSTAPSCANSARRTTAWRSFAPSCGLARASA